MAGRFKLKPPEELPARGHVLVDLEPAVFARLTEVAKKHGVSKKEIARQAVLFAIEELENG
ncbi:MAG TPA: hypothetical protein VFS17_04275 [Methylophilaceae bacterium]|nr:hypothetical protein [Methylophilaceae bacterium]